MSSFREKHQPPWAFVETPSGYKVLDASGNSLCYIYGDADHRTSSAGKLTMAEARTLAAMIAKLPTLVKD